MHAAADIAQSYPLIGNTQLYLVIVSRYAAQPKVTGLAHRPQDTAQAGVVRLMLTNHCRSRQNWYSAKLHLVRIKELQISNVQRRTQSVIKLRDL